MVLGIEEIKYVGVVVYVTILVVGATEDPTPAETAVKDYDKQLQKQKD